MVEYAGMEREGHSVPVRPLSVEQLSPGSSLAVEEEGNSLTTLILFSPCFRQLMSFELVASELCRRDSSEEEE